VFRRQSQAEPAIGDTTDAEAIKEAGKGRPTPKRRESQRPRRQLGAAPKDRKEAVRLQRQANRAQRAKVREAMQTGDDRYLPARDKGPVRRFARDFIDSRRSAAEFFLFGALLILALSIVPSATIGFAVGLAWVGMCVVIIVDSILITRRLKREIRVRFPNEDSKGVVPYTLLRSMQFRGLRMPKPRVRPGAPV
jgi:Protein of unknown function (DUF3043)